MEEYGGRCGFCLLREKSILLPSSPSSFKEKRMMRINANRLEILIIIRWITWGQDNILKIPFIFPDCCPSPTPLSFSPSASAFTYQYCPQGLIQQSPISISINIDTLVTRIDKQENNVRVFGWEKSIYWMECIILSGGIYNLFWRLWKEVEIVIHSKTKS